MAIRGVSPAGLSRRKLLTPPPIFHLPRNKRISIPSNLRKIYSYSSHLNDITTSSCKSSFISETVDISILKVYINELKCPSKEIKLRPPPGVQKTKFTPVGGLDIGSVDGHAVSNRNCNTFFLLFICKE